MVKRMKMYLWLCLCLLMLTGCPWGGMKYYPSETAKTYASDDSICFHIADEKDYQPVFIAINLRNTPPKDSKFTKSPKLNIVNGKFCIPPSFYKFPVTSLDPFIIQVVLRSQNKNNHPRNFVIGFEMHDKMPYDVPLTKREYDEL